MNTEDGRSHRVEAALPLSIAPPALGILAMTDYCCESARANALLKGETRYWAIRVRHFRDFER